MRAPCFSMLAALMLAPFLAAASPMDLEWQDDVLTGDVLTCRSLHTMVAFEPDTCKHLLVFGGFNFSSNEIIGSGPLLYRDELWIFRGLIQHWVHVVSPLAPPARGGHSAFLYNKSTAVMIIHGGCNNTNVFGDMWLLSSAAPCTFQIGNNGEILHDFVWEQVQPANFSASAPAPRWGHVGIYMPCGYIVFGGFSSALGNLTLPMLPSLLDDPQVWLGNVSRSPTSLPANSSNGNSTGSYAVTWVSLNCSIPPRAAAASAPVGSDYIVIISGLGQYNQSQAPSTIVSLDEVILVDLRQAYNGGCSWHVLRPIWGGPRGTPYPTPFVSFASAVFLIDTMVALYGGVRIPLTFINNANLNAASNNILSQLTIDTGALTFAWVSVSSPPGSVAATYFPTPRGTAGAAMTLFEHSFIMAFGGFSPYTTQCVSQLFVADRTVWDVLGHVWTRVDPVSMPPNLYQPAAVSVSTSDRALLVLSGGQVDDDVYDSTIRVWMLVEGASSWLSLTTTHSVAATGDPVARWAHTMVHTIAAGQDLIVMFGGLQAGSLYGSHSATDELWVANFSSDFYQYHWVKLVPQGPAPPARFQHTAVVFGDQWMVVYGGFASNASLDSFGDLWLLPLSSFTGTVSWTQLTSLSASSLWPPSRGAHVSAYFGTTSQRTCGSSSGCMLVYSGAVTALSSQALGDVWRLHLTGNGNSVVASWTQQPGTGAPGPRQGAASVVVDQYQWIVVGGLTGGDNSPLSETWIYADGTWTQRNTQGLPGIYSHAAGYTLKNSSLALYSLGGIASAETGTRRGMLSYRFAWHCPPGTFLSGPIDFYCEPCSIGTYSTVSDRASCTACSDQALTNQTGSTSVEFCNQCNSDLSCSGRGTCTADAQRGVVVCHCTGWYRWSDGSNCQTPVVAVVVGCLLGLLLVSVAAVLVWMRVHGERRRMRGNEKELRTLLIARDAEVLDLRKAWEISWADIELVKEIGRGVFGCVYAAQWRDLKVAVKTVPGCFGDMCDDLSNIYQSEIDKEISFLQTVRHPNIVLFFGAGTMLDRSSFLVTELIEQGSLTDVLRKNPSLAWERKLVFALDTARGMAHVHSLGRMHRDLKSSNLLVSASWHVKVADFGTASISGLVGESQAAGNKRSKHTDLGLETGDPGMRAGVGSAATHVGTPMWMAPEVIQGRPSGPPADVFSYGIVLWEIGQQQLPWHDLPPSESFILDTLLPLLLQGCRPQYPRQLWPPSYCTLMEACWATDPTRRTPFTQACTVLEEAVEAMDERGD